MARKFSDKRGTVAIIFALTIIPILGCIGLAIDYGLWLRAKSELNQIADSAALIAATTAANDFIVNTPNFIKLGETTGTQWFNAQVTNIGYVTGLTPTVTVVQNGVQFNSTVTYNSAMDTIFGKIFNTNSFALTDTASATTSVAAYVNVQVLMDTSSSMSIAATPDGMIQLGQAIIHTPGYNSYGQGSTNCGFACHFSNSPAKNADFLAVARSNNIPLRLDILTSALQNLIRTMINQDTINQFSVGLFTFDIAPATVYPTSTDLTDAIPAASSKIAIPYTPNESLEADTNFTAAMQYMTNVIPQSGDGSTSTNPKQYLFIITDGVNDYYAGANGTGRTLGVMDSSQCTALKNKGVQIMVLYTQYYQLENTDIDYIYYPLYNAYYVDNIAAFNDPLPLGGLSQAEQALASCASSPSNFYMATSQVEINAAMQNMVNAALASPGRFTK
jgi:Flp pilus assembly protein TadG